MGKNIRLQYFKILLSPQGIPPPPFRENIDGCTFFEPAQSTVKPVKNGHSQKDQKLVFKTNYALMQVKSIAECSKRSILQYFRSSLSYHLSLRSLFCCILVAVLHRFYCIFYKSYLFKSFSLLNAYDIVFIKYKYFEYVHTCIIIF